MAGILALIAFGLYLFFGIINAIILTPTSRLKAKRTGSSYVDANDLQSMYRANRPGILRSIKLLNLCVEYSGLFYATGVFLLLIVTWERISLLRCVLVIASSVAAYMLFQLILTAIGSAIDAAIMRKPKTK